MHHCHLGSQGHWRSCVAAVHNGRKHNAGAPSRTLLSQPGRHALTVALVQPGDADGSPAPDRWSHHWRTNALDLCSRLRTPAHCCTLSCRGQGGVTVVPLLLRASQQHRLEPASRHRIHALLQGTLDDRGQPDASHSGESRNEFLPALTGVLIFLFFSGSLGGTRSPCLTACTLTSCNCWT